MQKAAWKISGKMNQEGSIQKYHDKAESYLSPGSSPGLAPESILQHDSVRVSVTKLSKHDSMGLKKTINKNHFFLSFRPISPAPEPVSSREKVLTLALQLTGGLKVCLSPADRICHILSPPEAILSQSRGGSPVICDAKNGSSVTLNFPLCSGHL